MKVNLVNDSFEVHEASTYDIDKRVFKNIPDADFTGTTSGTGYTTGSQHGKTGSKRKVQNVNGLDGKPK